MFVPDTNILSVMMSIAPEPLVAAWSRAQNANALFTTTISQAEVFAGLAIMPVGRRGGLEAAAHAMFFQDFEGRVLPFDMEAARAYAAIFSERRRAGRSVPSADLMIAAIARCQGAAVVTRTGDDFEGCGISVVNPWSI
jgi:predicted nucleic acid-binding protein